MSPAKVHRAPALKVRETRYAVFRGNGYSFLCKALERRGWTAASFPSPGSAELSKLEENMLLAKALESGGVAFGAEKHFALYPAHAQGLPSL